MRSFEQIRLKPCGEGSRAACTAGSQAHVLYDASASHASMSTRPLVGGVCAFDVIELSESLEHAPSIPKKPVQSSPASLIGSSISASARDGARAQMGARARASARASVTSPESDGYRPRT